MPKTYAIEIGKVVLHSSQPITEEDRKEAIRLLRKNARIFPTATSEAMAEPYETEG